MVTVVGIYWRTITGSGSSCTLASGSEIMFITHIMDALAGHNYRAITSYKSPTGLIYKDNSGNYIAGGTSGTATVEMYSSVLNLAPGLWTLVGTDIYQDDYYLTTTGPNGTDGLPTGRCVNLTVTGTACSPTAGLQYCDSSGRQCKWSSISCQYDCYGCPSAYECQSSTGDCVLKTATQYTVTMTIVGSGTVTVSSGTRGTEYLTSSNSRTYSQFDEIRYNAVGASGYQFTSFNIDGNVTTLPDRVISVINSNRNITVTFTQIAAGKIVLNSVQWVTPSETLSKIRLNVTTNGSTSTYLKVDADAQKTLMYSSTATYIDTTDVYTTAIPHGVYIGTPTPTQYKNLLAMGYSCANCSNRIFGGTYSTVALCTSGCAVAPTKYGCSNSCATPIAGGTYSTVALCTAGCATPVVGWKCSGTGTGTCTSGTGALYTFPDRNTCQTTAPCAVVAGSKWKCTGANTGTCVVDPTGTYNDKETCEAAADCVPIGQHLACNGTTCQYVSGGGANTEGCATVGQTCAVTESKDWLYKTTCITPTVCLPNWQLVGAGFFFMMMMKK